MWGWINTAISKLIWWVIIQGPLNLLNGFWNVFEYLTGNIYLDILFGGQHAGGYNPDNTATTGVLWGMPYAFWAFWLVAGFMVILIFAIQYFMLIFQDEENTKQKFLTAVKNTLKGFGLTLVMPAAFFIGCYLMQFFQKVVFAAFGNENSSLADILYNVGNPSPTKDIPHGFGAPDNIGNYNIIATVLGTWFMLYACAMVGLAMAGKLFELYCLFIISPIFAASYSADGGQRFKTWKDACMAKMLVVVANVLVFMTFLTLLPIVMKFGEVKTITNPDFNPNLPITDKNMPEITTSRFGTGLMADASTLVFQLLVILGGGTFVQTMPTWFASIIGEAAGMAEGKSFSDNARAAGGMLRSGALGVAGALGVGMTAKGKAVNKFKAKQEYAALTGQGGGIGGGASLAPAAAMAGTEFAGDALAAGVGAAAGTAAVMSAPGIFGFINRTGKKIGHNASTLSKALFGHGETKGAAREELKGKLDNIRSKGRNAMDHLTFRNVRKAHGGGNSKKDQIRDMKRKSKDLQRQTISKMNSQRGGAYANNRAGKKALRADIKRTKQGFAKSREIQAQRIKPKKSKKILV